MLDRKRGRRSRPDGAHAARQTRSPGARVLVLGALSAMAVALGLLGAMGAFASGGAPGAETERAVEVTRTEAILNATVNPHGFETECNFEYGTTQGALNESVPCRFKPGHRSISVPENANLVGLTQGTTYYFRIHASNINGPSNGEEKQFTTLPAAPKANTEPAKEVKRTSATLTGKVKANGSELTECYFEWGPSKEGPLTERTSCLQTEFQGGSEPSPEVFVSAHISGLTEGQLYYYRLFAKNAVGEDLGGKNHFQALPGAPKANTEPAKGITETEAELRGFVTPNDSKVTGCEFVYGVSGGPLNQKAECASFGAGSGETPEFVSAQLTGLTKGTNYTYHLVATNGVGTDEGGNNAFHTLPAGPKVEMHHANNVTATSAELSASVDPEGAPTECYFEYGTTPALGGVAPCEMSPGEGEKFVKVGAKVSGLNPSTTYLVRIVAFNEQGSARGGEGEKHNFTTAVGGQAPVITKPIKPKKGPSGGKTTVTIVGEHFENVRAVYFGGTEGTIHEETVGKILAVSPPGVGKVDITVETAAGTTPINKNDSYTYGKPTITSLIPDEGPESGGTEVVITGSGFELGNHGTEVEFGKTKAASVECLSTTTCVVIAPAKPPKTKSEVNVRASVNGGKSNKVKFKYTP